MPNLIASTNDGYQSSALLTDWDAVHDHVGVGNPTISPSTSTFHAVRYEYVTARGGVRYYLARSFFDFDTSGISVAPSTATFKLKIYNTNTCTPCLVLKSLHDPSAPYTDWFSTFHGVIGAWTSGDVTVYSPYVAIGSTDAFTDFILNEDARDDMASLDTLTICVLHKGDYTDDAPISGNLRTGVYWANHATAQNRPYIYYTGAGRDNATFFGTNF